MFSQDRYSQNFILIYCCPSNTTSVRNFAQLFFWKWFWIHVNAVLPYVRGLHNMMPLHGQWLYARNIMFSKQLFLHKECIGGLKTNLRSHAKTCLLITCSCKNHEKMNKHAHLDDIQRYGWGTLAHLSWTSIGLMCFPSGFWGYLAEILKTLRKYNQFSILSILCSSALTSTPQKKKENHRENQKNTQT